MAYQIFQIPKAVPLSDGRVLPGAKAYFYETGTTTPQDVYSDSGLTTPHTNPVVADSAGVFPAIYLDPTLQYKITLKSSADVLVYTIDPANDQTLSQSIIAQLLNPQTDDEAAAGVTPSDYAGVTRPWTDAVLRYGLVGDGTTDNTSAFTRMFSIAGQSLFIKRGTYKTGKFSIPSNTTLYLEPGTVIRDTGVLGVNDRYINIYTEDNAAPVENVHIIGWGATVQLIKANYGTGEQRHSVFIAGNVDNVCIEGLTSIDSGGDGFYVGGVGGGLTLTPDNIRLIGVTSDNCRRNGLSITAGRSVTVAYSLFANTDGTSPADGIDIEPDASGGAMVCDLEDILILGCRTVGNSGCGYSFIGGPYTTVGRKISVTFQDCVSDGDNINFQIGATRSDANGAITFRNCKGFDALTNGFDCQRSGMRCEVDGMWIYNANQAGGSVERTGSSYSIYSVNMTDGTTYGNIRIRNAYAIGTSQLKTFVMQLVGEPTSVIANVDAEIDTTAVGAKRAFYSLSSAQISGKHRVKFIDETEIPTSTNIGTSSMPAYLNDVITNTGAVAQVILNLDSATTRLKGIRVKARITAAQNLVLNPGTGWTIGGSAALWSNTVGSEVTVESDGVAKWRIVEGGEGWHREPIVLANSATPSVSNGTMFETGGTTTITGFSGGVLGQEITVFIKHAVTIDTTGTTLKGNAGTDITAASGDILRAVYDGTNWRVSFSDCT